VRPEAGKGAATASTTTTQAVGWWPTSGTRAYSRTWP